MPSGVKEREIYVPYVKGAILEVNGNIVGKECLNKNQTEYVICAFTPDGMTFTYKNTKGEIKEKEYRVEETEIPKHGAVALSDSPFLQ